MRYVASVSMRFLCLVTAHRKLLRVQYKEKMDGRYLNSYFDSDQLTFKGSKFALSIVWCVAVGHAHFTLGAGHGNIF